MEDAARPRRRRRQYTATYAVRRAALADVAIHAVLPWDATKEDNLFCYDQLRDEVYPATLSGIRAMVDAVSARR